MGQRATEVFLDRGGAFNGVQPLGAFAGVNNQYLPHWGIVERSTGLTTTATRLYYIPYYFNEMREFTGLKTRNNGAGDNTDTFRMGVYKATLNSTGTRGAPSTLLVDCGEVTLTAAAAERTLASAFTPDYVGWHFLAFHANQAAAMSALQVNFYSSSVGTIVANTTKYSFGGSVSNDFTALGVAAYYVDTAYGALASTAVAPTATTTIAPIVAPYLT